MGRNVEKKVVLGIIIALVIGITLAFYTDNPEQGTPNNELNESECKSIGFYAPECPEIENQTKEDSSKNNRSSSQPDNSGGV